VVRPASRADAPAGDGRAGVERVRLDLRSPAGLDAALGGCEAVLHLAAAKQGDLHAQMADTVVATEHLLDAMVRSGVTRLVAVSSFAVYEYLRRWSRSTLDEDSPLAEQPQERDAYAQAKGIQDALLRRAARGGRIALTLLRPGVIYGPEHLWTARIGLAPSPDRWVMIGGRARIPLTYVEHCAEAVLLAVENNRAIGQILNLVDDDPPTQGDYVRAVCRRLASPPRVLVVPWPLARGLARAAWLVNRLLFRGRARMPAPLQPAQLHARVKPMRYDNRRAREILGWRPRYTLDEALDRILGHTAGREASGRRNPVCPLPADPVQKGA
jgi:nucleoside-diphosphate-sugar epimerase